MDLCESIQESLLCFQLSSLQFSTRQHGYLLSIYWILPELLRINRFWFSCLLPRTMLLSIKDCLKSLCPRTTHGDLLLTSTNCESILCVHTVCCVFLSLLSRSFLCNQGPNKTYGLTLQLLLPNPPPEQKRPLNKTYCTPLTGSLQMFHFKFMYFF